MSPEKQYKLLIHSVFEKNQKRFKKINHITQNQPVRFGLNIKNIDSDPTPEFSIQNLFLKSSEGVDIEQRFDETFEIPKLNPGQTTILWWPEPFTPIIKGQTWINCSILPKNPGTQIKTYQFDKKCAKNMPYEINSWAEAISITGEMEFQQMRTNTIMLWLTILVFLDGVFGLQVIAKFILNSLGTSLSFIGISIKNLLI